MICIAIAALLLSLTGGMFLLAKIQKENLGAFYKVMAWLIIVASLATLLCCSICCVAMKQCMMMRHHEQREMMCKEGRMDCCGGESCNMGGMMHGGGNCSMMHERGGKCSMEMTGHESKGKCCDEEGEDGDEMKREIIVKDTVNKK